MLAGARIERAREASAAVEPFFYSYGLNPTYRTEIEERGLAISGTGTDGVLTSARAFVVPRRLGAHESNQDRSLHARLCRTYAISLLCP